MANSRRKIGRRIFITLFSLLLIITLLVVSLTFFYRNTVGQLIVNRLSEHIATPFEAESVSLSIFTKPFSLTLSLNKLKVQESEENKSSLIAEAEQVHFVLDVIDLVNGRYNVEEIYIENAQIKLLVDRKGKSNYDNFFSLNLPANPNAKVQFHLKNIYFENVKIIYENKSKKELVSLVFQDTKAIFTGFKGVILNANLEGSIKDLSLNASKIQLLKYPLSNFNVKIAYDPAKEQLYFDKGKFNFRESNFLWEGEYHFKENKADNLDFKFKGAQENLSTLIAILPEEWYEKLIDYKSEGKIIFNGKFKGEWDKKSFPSFKIDFKAENIALRSPNISQTFEQVNFIGSISNGESNSLTTSSLSLSEVTGKLNDRNFTLAFNLVNWLDPDLYFELEAGVDLGAFVEFFPIDDLEEAQGFIGGTLNFKGKLSELKNTKKDAKIIASGDLQLRQVSFKLKQRPLAFENFEGDFIFKDNRLIIEKLNGKAGSSDFDIKGEAINFLSYIFLPDGKFALKGKLISTNINLEELLKQEGVSVSNQISDVKTHQYLFDISPQIAFKLNVKVDTLEFKDFKARNLTTDVVMKEQILRTSNLNMNIANGTMSILGILNAQKADFIKFDGRIFFKNVRAEKLLASFDNFSQDFIKAPQIRGTLEADWQTAFVFNHYLEFNFPNLVTDIGIKVKNGTLLGFLPWQRLIQFLRTKELRFDDNIAFKELNTQIQIRNQSIFIPEMKILTAKEQFSVIGSSSFNEEIDYRVRIPIFQQSKNKQEKNIFYVSLKGSFESMRLSFLEFPNIKTLEANWQREKKAFLSLFNEIPIEEKKIQIDTVETAFFEF